MSQISRMCCGALMAAGLLAGCVASQQSRTDTTGSAMSIAALDAALVGNSIVATRVDGSGSYCAYHATETRPGGSMLLHGVDNGQNYRGLYRVEVRPNADNPGDPAFVCYSYPDTGVFADCKMVRATGSQVAILQRAGEIFATGEIRPGDACGQGT